MHLQKFLLSALAFFSLSAPALAGGIGVMGTGGVHMENVYFYDDDEQQYLQLQFPPSYGAGFQVLLGDRDDRIQGTMKLFWLADTPPSYEVALPADFEGDEPTMALREENRNVGMATAGIQWGLLGDPSGFSFNLITNLGAGVITLDLTEFAYAEIGPGVHYSLSKTLQVFGEATFQPRWRKGLTYGGGAAVGVRYMFD